MPRWQWFTDYNNPGNRIWLAWNGEFIDVDIVDIEVQFIHCRILIRSLHISVMVTVVYGDNEIGARRDLWQALCSMAGLIGQEPWLVGGDFNAVRDLSEVCGASGDIRLAMHDFNNCILRAGLIALPMRGVLYSWHNCSTDGRSLWKHLDRLLVNDMWLERWPDAHYECLTPRTSDHSPLLLRGDVRDPHVSMFRFDNFLALSPGFIAYVQNVWWHRIIGTPMYSVTRKLKALKPVFRQQRKEKGDISLNTKLAAEFLEISQQLLMAGRHDSLLLHLETCCRMVYLKATKLEQVMLQQRAKMQCMKGGDQYTRVFFRRVAMRHANKRNFQISDDDGHTYTEPKDVSDTFVAYFERLLADRATGPDGFSSGFFKAAGPVVGEEIMAAVKDFFTPGRLLKQVNATLITLIPKQFIEQDGDFAYHWKCKDLGLFQLSFADDLLLLCKAEKSQLIISKAAHEIRISLLDTLGFQEGHLPVREGQLIKSVLLALGVYWAMAFLLPKGVIKEINKRPQSCALFFGRGILQTDTPRLRGICVSSSKKVVKA
ncbi:UNVERIFIED_CONTAM: hypothetical protein Scaly_2807700 [Sesamum calycinum]|uniref:Reverse transcriptase n=1 Tax=Sesamum calycinum TaxID=2727403 RepID=A0AAW2IVC3_9LAMI